MDIYDLQSINQMNFEGVDILGETFKSFVIGIQQAEDKTFYLDLHEWAFLTEQRMIEHKERHPEHEILDYSFFNTQDSFLNIARKCGRMDGFVVYLPKDKLNLIQRTTVRKKLKRLQKRKRGFYYYIPYSEQFTELKDNEDQYGKRLVRKKDFIQFSSKQKWLQRNYNEYKIQEKKGRLPLAERNKKMMNQINQHNFEQILPKPKPLEEVETTHFIRDQLSKITQDPASIGLTPQEQLEQQQLAQMVLRKQDQPQQSQQQIEASKPDDLVFLPRQVETKKFNNKMFRPNYYKENFIQYNKIIEEKNIDLIKNIYGGKQIDFIKNYLQNCLDNSEQITGKPQDILSFSSEFKHLRNPFCFADDAYFNKTYFGVDELNNVQFFKCNFELNTFSPGKTKDTTLKKQFHSQYIIQNQKNFVDPWTQYQNSVSQNTLENLTQQRIQGIQSSQQSGISQTQQNSSYVQKKVPDLKPKGNLINKAMRNIDMSQNSQPSQQQQQQPVHNYQQSLQDLEKQIQDEFFNPKNSSQKQNQKQVDKEFNQLFSQNKKNQGEKGFFF